LIDVADTCPAEIRTLLEALRIPSNKVVRLYRYDARLPTDGIAPSTNTTGSPSDIADALSGARHSTLIVLLGPGAQATGPVVQDFCRTVAIQLTVATLTRQIQEAKMEYEDHVSLMAHSLRTPLGILSLETEALQRNLPFGSPQAARVDRSLKRIGAINEDITYLLQMPSHQTDTFDLAEIVTDTIDYLRPLAEEHECRLVKTGTWPTTTEVAANEVAIGKAVLNILDNAIKYSYRSSEVRVGVKSGGEHVCVTISNVGIGIPQAIIDSLLQGHPVRATVADKGPKGRERQGTGNGVVSAIRAFHSAGGTLAITSKPRGNPVRMQGQDYQNYFTEVSFTLPMRSFDKKSPSPDEPNITGQAHD
jgi:signal transduction histidine kinase